MTARPLLPLLLAVGCAQLPAPASGSAPRLSRAEADDVVQAALAAPATDPALLAAGEAGYRAQCDRCHDYAPPDAYGSGDWADILPTMLREARVDPAEARAISAWVLAGAAP